MAALRYFGLIDSDLAALASGSFTTALISRLQSAVFSRNALLMEDLRRIVLAGQTDEVSRIVESAIRLLAEVQARSPEVVRRLVISPHFGLWAADVLTRLRAHRLPGSPAAVAPQELGHIASFAAAAGLLTSHHFRLCVPVHDGVIVIPLVGRVEVPGVADWAEIRLDHNGMHVISDGCVQDWPITTTPRSLPNEGPVWKEAERLISRSGDLVLDLRLEDADPCLSRLSSTAGALVGEDRDEWRNRLSRAWQILVRRHREVAHALASSLSALVPLRAPDDGSTISAASGWAWGAIALSLPGDPVTFAETMIHEFRHLALGAAEDIHALISGDRADAYYSPWRDDPRPLSGMLQGCYAFCGVAAFWRRERYVGTATQRRRAELAFALRSSEVHRVVEVLAKSASLTGKGKAIVEAMRTQAMGWRSDCISKQATSQAREIRVLHHVRWRIANLIPDQDVIDGLARRWLSGRVFDPGQADLRAAVFPSPHRQLYDRSRLLERALTDPEVVPQLLPRLAAGDRHLLRGDHNMARETYLRQLSEDRDPNAWIGLVLSLRRIGVIDAGWSSPDHVEVLVAIAERVRELTGQFPDTEALLAWTQALCPRAAKS